MRFLGVAVGVVVPLEAGAVNGEEAETCEWPSVVFLRTRSSINGTYQICTGVYIGGRVVLTAAHCDDGNGLYYNYEELHEHLDIVPISGGGICLSDADCPSVTIEGVPVAMQCQDGEADHPSPFGSCFLPDESLDYSNFASEVLFGETYKTISPTNLSHPFNAVPVQYCKRFAHVSGGMGVDEGDFAYCVLTQKPDVEPVPIIMHCEVDEFLDGTHDLPVAAVGFGNSNDTETWGTKRWSTGSTDDETIPSTTVYKGYTPFNLSPGSVSGGDSGGPLFVQLPDGTWRVLFININAPFGLAPWHFVEWMLEDDEVAADVEDILPCHDVAGDWDPGPGCTSFPESPDTAAGQWSRGPTACYDSDLSGYSGTCGSPYMPLNPPAPPAPPTLAPGSDAVAHDESSRPASGCAATSVRTCGWFAALVAMGLVRRRRLGGLAIVALLSSGCQDDSPLTDDGGDDEVGDTGPVEPLDINPNVAHVTSGIYFPGDKYEEIAVGNVVRPINDSTCCLDYVIGGEAERSIRLLRGGGSTTGGLTFLASTADVVLTMADAGQGIDDLALVDLDADGDNDLVALTTNSELARRRGNGASGTPFAALAQYSASTGGASAADQLAVGDMDCDGDADVTTIAPGQDKVLIMANNGTGVFGAPTAYTVGDAPVDVAVGDLDGAGQIDFVTINGDATMSIGLADICSRPRPATQAPFEFIDFYDPGCTSGNCVSAVLGEVHILPVCGDADNDIVVAIADKVLAYCNEGDGVTFAEGEDQNTWSFSWDLNGQSSIYSMQTYRAHSPHLWQVPDGPDAFFVVNGQADVLIQLSSDSNAYGLEWLPFLALRNGWRTQELVLSAHTGAGADWWERAAWVGSQRMDGAPGNADGQMGFAR